MDIQHLYEKICSGDKLTDKEIIAGCAAYKLAEESLITLGAFKQGCKARTTAFL